MAGGAAGNKVNKKFVEAMAKATHFSEKVHIFNWTNVVRIIVVVITTAKEIERLLDLHHKKGTRDKMDRKVEFQINGNKSTFLYQFLIEGQICPKSG